MGANSPQGQLMPNGLVRRGPTTDNPGIKSGLAPWLRQGTALPPPGGQWSPMTGGTQQPPPTNSPLGNWTPPQPPPPVVTPPPPTTTAPPPVVTQPPPTTTEPPTTEPWYAEQLAKQAEAQALLKQEAEAEALRKAEAEAAEIAIKPWTAYEPYTRAWYGAGGGTYEERVAAGYEDDPNSRDDDGGD